MNVSKRNNPEYSSWSPNSRSENYAETSCSQFESRSLTLRAVSKQPLKLGGHSRSRPPFHRRGGVPEQRNMFPENCLSRRTACGLEALDLISSSPFSREIEKAKLPERFTAPCFEAYNDRTDPVAHISHYQQMMALSCYNDPLMCRLFPSSLGEVALRWFNQLGR